MKIYTCLSWAGFESANMWSSNALQTTAKYLLFITSCRRRQSWRPVWGPCRPSWWGGGGEPAAPAPPAAASSTAPSSTSECSSDNRKHFFLNYRNIRTTPWRSGGCLRHANKVLDISYTLSENPTWDLNPALINSSRIHYHCSTEAVIIQNISFRKILFLFMLPWL